MYRSVFSFQGWMTKTFLHVPRIKLKVQCGHINVLQSFSTCFQGNSYLHGL